METGEGPNHGFKNWRQRLSEILRGLKEGVDFSEKKIPIEEINAPVVAQVILANLGIRAKEKRGFGKRWDNSFSNATVLKYLGYSAWLTGTDYLKKFPEAHQASRQALYVLVREEALKQIDQGKKDANQESIHYQVINEERLREIASPKETVKA